MQLAAYGAQDVYLTGNPDITFFKIVYRRHTNFAMESIENTFNTEAKFGSRVTSVISRNGDLVSGIYLQATLPDITEKGVSDFGITSEGFDMPNRRYTRWIDNIGHYLIKTVEIEIGGQVIDRHYSDWLEIWAQLTVPASQMEGYRKMIGQDPYNVFGQNTGLQADVLRAEKPVFQSQHFPNHKGNGDAVLVGREIYVPLQFWFCRDYGAALPLIALQHHEVRINVEFRNTYELIMSYGTKTGWAEGKSVIHDGLDVSLWVDYIYLDHDERRAFAQVSHEYLIEQLNINETTVETGTDEKPRANKVDLYFDHPIKELVWVCKPFSNAREFCNFSNTRMKVRPPLDSVILQEDTAPQAGLSGLPAGRLGRELDDINAVYRLPGHTTIQRGQVLTVTDDPDANLLTNDTIIFNPPDQLRFRLGDLVVINDQNEERYIELLVSDVDENFRPLAFRTVTSIQNALPLPRLYVFVVAVDQIGSNATVNADGIASLTGCSLQNITTFPELIDFASYNSTRPYNSLGLSQNPVKYAGLQLNGYDISSRLPGVYFNRYQPYKCHSNAPQSPGINVYSFAIKPEDQQPSGSCNFSRLNTARLLLWIGGLYDGGSSGKEIKDQVTIGISVYAVNYNVLRIMSGMAGLAYHWGN